MKNFLSIHHELYYQIHVKHMISSDNKSQILEISNFHINKIHNFQIFKNNKCNNNFHNNNYHNSSNNNYNNSNNYNKISLSIIILTKINNGSNLKCCPKIKFNKDNNL